MPTTKVFDQYELRVCGGNTDRVGLAMLYNLCSFIGRIDFYPDGVELLTDYLWHPNPISESIVLNMPMNRFSSIMSILQEDRPL